MIKSRQSSGRAKKPISYNFSDSSNESDNERSKSKLESDDEAIKEVKSKTPMKKDKNGKSEDTSKEKEENFKKVKGKVLFGKKMSTNLYYFY